MLDRTDLSSPISTTQSVSDPSVIIDVADVSMRYGATNQAERVLALFDVSLKVNRGEFVSLIGPSGCGKTTLLRLLADLLTPSTGQITVNGQSPSQTRQNRGYGFVPQAPTLYDWRTVLKNVELPLEILKLPKVERRERATQLLDLVGLKDFYNKYPWQLSGGMQQRVSIARALSFKPSILLMDEPFGALDEMTRERLNAELLKIWQETGTTIIFVTHSIPEAVFLSTRIVVMSPRPGRIATIVPVDLPAPRGYETRELPRYFELVTRIRDHLKEFEHGD